MFPDWLTVILLILTFVSFLPQFFTIWTRKDASGISLSSIYFNLIAATEHVCMNSGFMAMAIWDGDAVGEGGTFTHEPIASGDWINLYQNISVWAMFLGYFWLCLWYPSTSTSRQKRWFFWIYLAYFVIAILPVLATEAILVQARKGDTWSELPFVMAFVPHSMIGSYVATLLSILAVYQQAQLILNPQPSSAPAPADILPTSELDSPSVQSTIDYPYGSLSLTGLATQALVFVPLAISWVFRAAFALPDGVDFWHWRIVQFWYEWVGWVVVDSMVFGVGQAILYLRALRRAQVEKGIRDDVLGTEREPLLGNSVE
ncbi:hypothetical protein BJX70DRAFT_359832 [Aspergillus crustosus]